MSDVSYPSLTATDLAALAALIPAAPTVAPMTEATAGAIGTLGMYASAQHVHPRLTSVTTGTLDGTGTASVTFARSFLAQPGVILTAIAPGGTQPIILQVQGFTLDGNNNYTGCLIKGFRTNTLPSTLSVLTALIGFNIAGGTATGVVVSVVAIQTS